MTVTGDTGINLARGSWRIPRSRGATAGVLLMGLGAWGTLIPFIGPAFNFGFGGGQTWAWTAARFWLEVLPGIACFVGGLMLATSANRGATLLGAWLAIAAGAWFVIGPTLATPLHLGALGLPMGGSTRVAWTWLLFFYGLGALILIAASTAHGRLSVRSLRDIEHANLQARSKQLARQGGMVGGFGARGREREPARQYTAADDRRDRADARTDQTPVYPTDSARADRGPSADAAMRGEPVDTGRHPVATPTSDAGMAGSPSTDAPGRHQASHEGIGDRIGRTLARHGIGGKSRQ
jgi:hypothetical protein